MGVLKDKMSNDTNSDVLEEKKEDFDKLFNDKNLIKVKEKVKEKNKSDLPNQQLSQNNQPEQQAAQQLQHVNTDNQGYMISKEKERKYHPVLYVFISIISLIIILLSIIICYNIFYKKIFANIYISGINVSSLTKEEAISKINSEMKSKLEKEITVIYDDKEKKIKPIDLGGVYNTEQVVEEAYRIGRGGNIFENNVNMVKTFFADTNMDLEFDYEEEKLNQFITDINSQFSSLVQSSYEILEDKVIIKKGTSGIEIKGDVLKEKIITNIENSNFENIQVGVVVTQPDAIDIDAIHNEVYKAAVDASYTKDPFEIHESQTGVDFAITVDEAKALLEEDKEQYEINLRTLYPTITTDQIGTEAFPDLLSTCTTSYIASKVGRTTNLKIASSKINGYVLMPGDTFSYNQVVGKRTAEAGFQLAGVYSGGKEVEGLGGGICQISSTLYNIVVKSNLEIVQRENHVFLPGYLPAGQDATVVWGAIDFKFKNTRDYPVKIVSSVGGGYVTMKMYGMKVENEPEISFETVYHQTLYPKTIYEDTTDLPAGQEKVTSSGKNGCKSTTYKVVKQNGQVVSKTVLSTDTYQAMNKYVSRGVKKQEAAPVSTQPAAKEEKKEEVKTETTNNTNKVQTNNSTPQNTNNKQESQTQTNQNTAGAA